MSDLKLKKAYVRNWMRYAESAVEFPDSGVVVVTGSNLASGGKLLSVGSGKTGLGEAISRALLGVDGRYPHLRQYSTKKKGNTYVKVEAELRGKPLVVEMGYKCKEMSDTGEALRFTYDGSTIERSRIQETRAELSKVVSVSSHLAEWTVFVDGDKIKFDRMSEQATVELLMSALAQPPWTDYHDRAKETLKVFKQEKAKAEATQTECQKRLGEAKDDILSAETAHATAKRNHAQKIKQAEADRKKEQNEIKRLNESITTAKVRRAAIVKEVNAIVESKAVQDKALEIERNDLNDGLTVLQENRDRIVTEKATASASFTAENSTLTKYKSTPKVCPTCSKPWDTVHGEEEIARQKKVVDDLRTKYNNLATELKTAEGVILAAKEKIKAVETKLREEGGKQALNDLRDEDAQLEEDLTTVLSDIHQHELNLQKLTVVDDTPVKQAEATLQERKRVVKQCEKALEESATGIVDAEAGLRVVEYWTRAYSPVGIPNMILNEAVAPLNHEAKRVSSLMTGNTIEVNFATSRQLASGDQRAELVISVDNKLGSDELAGSSKGEAGLTNFIVAETLSEVGQVSKRIGYRWYDEVVPHQDPVVCHSIYTYLRQMAEKYDILIFLVDHNPIAANYADYVLVAEKTDKGTTLRWD